MITGFKIVNGDPGITLFSLSGTKLSDNNEEKIRVNMNVNRVNQVYEDGSKNVVSVELVSEEFLRNEMGETRCRSREIGAVSDHVEKIFTDRLKTEKLNILNSKISNLDKYQYWPWHT